MRYFLRILRKVFMDLILSCFSEITILLSHNSENFFSWKNYSALFSSDLHEERLLSTVLSLILQL